MTSIVIWKNDESPLNPNLWVVADSRVSNDNRKLIDDATKIFQLPIIIKSPGKDGFFSNIYFQYSFGYCFAGSTLMGQNSYLSLLPLLSNLVSVESDIPSLREISNYALNYFQKTFVEYLEVHTINAMFEASIFGYCHVEKKLQAAHFYPTSKNEGMRITLKMENFDNGTSFLYLGDEKDLMKDKIYKYMEQKTEPGRPNSRAPRYAIEDAINDDSLKTIGGDIQLGIANSNGFEFYKICKPYEQGKPESYISYLGRELTPELSIIGKTRVGGYSMI